MKQISLKKKAISHNGSIFVYLPSEWCKTNDVNKGSEIWLTINELNELILSSEAGNND